MEEFVFPTKFVWEEQTAIYGKLITEPYCRGFGITVGNALRRVLLSSIPGVAVTGLRIEGVPHEFSTIEGVKEDVTEIVLNLKQVNLKPVISEFPHTVQVEINKTGDILAKDLFPDGSVEVLNGNLYIATVTTSRKLKLELEITRGYGYLPVEKMHLMRKKSLPVGTIALDGMYSPVRKVTFHVENTRVGQSVDYEKLILEIWTTGAVSPAESIVVATDILSRHFSFIATGRSIEEKTEQATTGATGVDLLQVPIAELNISTRVKNVLASQNIKTIGQLVSVPKSELVTMKNLGEKSMEEINLALKEKGLELKEAKEISIASGEENET